MKMKRILGMALSAVLAFGLAFGIAPAKVAEATVASVHPNTFQVEDAVAGTYTPLETNDCSIQLSSGTIDTSSAFVQVIINGESYGIPAGHYALDFDIPVTENGTYPSCANTISSATVTYSVVYDGHTYNGTLELSTANDTQFYHLKGSVDFEPAGGSSSETPSDSGSGDSSSSGSSSGGSSSGTSVSSAYVSALEQIALGTTSDTATTTAKPVAAAKATPDMSENSTIDKATVKTAANGTAKISNIKSEATEIEIDSTVEVNGVSYKVKTLGTGALKSCDKVKTVTVPASVNKFEEGAFTGADNLKTVKINTKKAVKVEKGAFDGLNTSKMTIKVSKKMSDKEFAKLQKNLTKAGYKGKVTRSL